MEKKEATSKDKSNFNSKLEYENPNRQANKNHSNM